MEEKFIEEQLKLLSRLDLENKPKISKINNIAGVDLAYWKENDIEYAVCCIVVIDFWTKEIIEKKYSKDIISVPYIPGCLAFREIELVLKTVNLLETEVDVYVFDGNGYLHPRHMGLATQAGILLNKPSIGVAKSYYKINNVNYMEPDNYDFAYNDIKINGEIYGRVLRTHKNVKPVFVSIGNKMDIDLASEIIQELVTKESRIPIPTRYADIMTHEIRKKYIAST